MGLQSRIFDSYLALTYNSWKTEYVKEIDAAARSFLVENLNNSGLGYRRYLALVPHRGEGLIGRNALSLRCVDLELKKNT